MKQVLTIITLMSLVLCGASAKPQPSVTITLTNPTPLARIDEMVEVPVADIEKKLGSTSYIVTSANGDTLPCQTTYDGKLIFPSKAMQGKEKAIYKVTATATETSAKYESKVFGRNYPERQEDFSFENDRIGYRLYGPVTQRNGERLYGYDIFNKKTTSLILDELYADQTDGNMWDTHHKLNRKGNKKLATDLYMAFCYHIDHGKGMDCYKVGPTLGAGTNALINADGNIVYPWCYKTAEILDNGPLRLTVKLTYGDNETRILTVDAGSNMVKADITYTNAEAYTTACAGIVIHNENKEAYRCNKTDGYMAYEDLGDVNCAWDGYKEQQAKAMGKIFIGTYCPTPLQSCEFKAERINGATGHVLSKFPLPENGKFTYYFGSGWDRNPNTDFPDLNAWESYLKLFSQAKKSRLLVKIK